jgi:hypothetical protein
MLDAYNPIFVISNIPGTPRIRKLSKADRKIYEISCVW